LQTAVVNLKAQIVTNGSFQIRASKEQSKAILLDPILAVGPAVFENAEAVQVTQVSMPCAASLQFRRLLRGSGCGRFQSCGSAWNFQLFQFLVSQHQVPNGSFVRRINPNVNECRKKEIPHIWNETSEPICFSVMGTFASSLSVCRAI
jgi:hypothetical protein